MGHYNPKYPTLEELERHVFQVLQEMFGKVLTMVLEQMDAEIAEARDKRRFRLKDRRDVHIDTMFGPLTIKRNYYQDRENGRYIALLDQYLAFDGRKGFSPLLEQWAMALAVAGPSYRHAVKQLETFLGYAPMSHEALRQHLLASEVCEPKSKQPAPEVLFVEVDGLFVKQQKEKGGKKKKAKELKIALVHTGWEQDGSKRRKLKNKRHYFHTGSEPFWEGFESFLEQHYDYDATKTKLVINGDGAGWISACQDDFKGRAFYHLDRFHVARDLHLIMKDHPRYSTMRRALNENDPERLIVELNSAVGTMATPEGETKLEAFIAYITNHKEALRDYKAWLEAQGIDTHRLCTMGASEGLMSQFAARLKQGRSWSAAGVEAMTQWIIADKDRLEVKTWFGQWVPNRETNGSGRKALETKTRKRLTKQIVNDVRDNIPYMKQSSGTMIHRALKGLIGF